MSTDFLYNYEEAEVPAGMIARHPENIQRKSPLRQFFDKCGPYNQALNLSPALLVEDGEGGFHAIDGATRVEACRATKGYGDEALIKARIYANGRLPTEKEKAMLFLAANVDRIAVGATPRFKASLVAEVDAAMAAQRLSERLGPGFRARAGLMSLIEKRGEEAVTEAVGVAAETWPNEKNILMAVVKAVLQILADGQEDRLRQRRARLRKDGIDKLYQRARIAHYSKNGQRPSVGSCFVNVLLGFKA